VEYVHRSAREFLNGEFRDGASNADSEINAFDPCLVLVASILMEMKTLDTAACLEIAYEVPRTWGSSTCCILRLENLQPFFVANGISH